MNFNLVEMYNGLLRFNKHILNELAEGLKHLPSGTVVRSSWLINLFSVFVFLDTTPATVYYNIKYNKLKT